ncbi:MAG: hypothetical protein FWF81_05650 [Defluviitaleaceae bacterium]|nr:hypothetical protein [Defluviitaleaceae bacterium]
MKYALGIFVIFPALLFFPLLITRGYLSDLAFFIHAPALASFVFVIFATLMVTGEFKIFVKSVNALFSQKYKISAEDRDRGIKLFELLSKTVLYAVVFFVGGGIIIMLVDLNDFSNVGPMLAITIILPMYAAMINMIFMYPAIHILKYRKDFEKKVTINEKEVVNKLLELCYKQGISPEDIINAKEIKFEK